jgi:glycosyltransferase involved in cell wall biosynthesis
LSQPRLSVVLPAFQAEGRVGESVARVRLELSALADRGELEIVVADDGSTDGTVDEARRARADRVVVNDRNLGKGAAVKAGVAAARGRTVAFTDVDLAYPPAQILRLLEAVEAGSPMVVGSRWASASTASTRRWGLRKLNSRLFNLATRVTVGVWRDTQCGLKAFDAQAAEAIFGRARLNGFAFDVELFLAAEALGVDVAELPVQLDNRDETTVHLRGQVSAVIDLLRIRRRLRRGGYGPSPLPPS